ncbi:MAG: hypothetical protein FWE48_03830 [Coriobacteriia bacterium]|nr:hypothetical protein [Coriobacteriia bacterium]MCL2870364.1 hypothetical protein [Coriobacteriia bacterium]
MKTPIMNPSMKLSQPTSRKYPSTLAVTIFIALVSVFTFMAGIPALAHPPPDFIMHHLSNPAFTSYQVNQDGSAQVFFKTDNKDHVDWTASNLTEKEVKTGIFVPVGYETKGSDYDTHVVHLRSLLPADIGDNYSHNTKDNYFLTGHTWQSTFESGASYEASSIPWGLVSSGSTPAEIPAEFLQHKAFVGSDTDGDNVTVAYFETDDESIVDFSNAYISSSFVPTGNTYFDGYTTTGDYRTNQHNVSFASQLPADVGSNYTKQLALDSVTGLPVTVIGEYLMSGYNNGTSYSYGGYNWGLVYVETRQSSLPGDIDPFNNGSGTASYVAGWAVPAGFGNISTSILNGMSTGSSITVSGSIANYNAWVSNSAHRIPTTGNTGIVYMTVTRTGPNSFTWNKYIVGTVPVFHLEIFSYSEKFSEEMAEYWSWREYLQPEPRFTLENFSYSEVSVETTTAEWSWSVVATPAAEGPGQQPEPFNPGDSKPGDEKEEVEEGPGSGGGSGGNPGGGQQDDKEEPEEIAAPSVPGTTPGAGSSMRTVVNVGNEATVPSARQEEEPVAGPQTGDEANAFMYALLMLASLVVLFGTAYAKRKYLLPERKNL